jgi:uncharacterized protein (TIGR03118 family)
MLETLEDRCVPAIGLFQQTNLVSDIPGMAQFTDPNLINPWGITSSATSPFWISNNNSGTSTLYNGAGNKIPLTVTIPGPGGAQGTPTGVVFNGTSGFNGSVFIFATEDGTIAGWNPGVDLFNAHTFVDNSNIPPGNGAVYKGLAIGNDAAGQTLIYATNFRAGTIDVFDSNFTATKLAGSFTDPNLPSGYAPFGIQEIGGKLYVTYALQDSAKHDDVAGKGHGFVDVFSNDGVLQRRFASRGVLDSPWGLALAPPDMGGGSTLLVGNFGNGHIDAFDLNSGISLGPLLNTNFQPVTISGLWGLRFGNGHTAGPKDTLFFTAGINDEADGLFGTLTLASSGNVDLGRIVTGLGVFSSTVHAPMGEGSQGGQHFHEVVGHFLADSSMMRHGGQVDHSQSHMGGMTAFHSAGSNHVAALDHFFANMHQVEESLSVEL